MPTLRTGDRLAATRRLCAGERGAGIAFMCRIVTVVLLLAFASGCGERIADHRGIVTRCPVHDVDLQERVVPIQYGYPERIAKEEIEAWKQFRHSTRSPIGGCIVNDESPQKARIRCCPKCDEAAGTWKREFAREVMTPLADYMSRVQDALAAHGFKGIGVYISHEDVTTVLVDGSVDSQEDLGRLKQLAAAANPPRPVVWKVTVAGKR